MTLAGSGWVEVIVGGMFSGKTEELIRRLQRAKYARQRIQVFKPHIDDRYHAANVTSHNLNSIDSLPIKKASDIWDYLQDDTQIVGIDEGQFFDFELIQVVQDLAERGIRVIIAGLDTDWQGKAFEPMPTLMATAENVTKLQAVCVVCGKSASRSQRISRTKDLSKLDHNQIAVGSTDSYEARCREHFKPEILVIAEGDSSIKIEVHI